MTHADPARELLRHTVATVAYRAAKVLRNAPSDFSSFRVAPESRSAGEILAHMCDLFDWALTMAEGEVRWRDVPPDSWARDCERFFGALGTFDRYLAGGAPLANSAHVLFQGPVADALTHTGQLAMRRRLAAAPVRGESYAQADIAAGRTGADQSAPRFEFDS